MPWLVCAPSGSPAFSGTVNSPFVPFPRPIPRLAYVYVWVVPAMVEQLVVPSAEGVLQ